ncbi:MAG: hypothetical protein KIG14_01105 [Candidatus Sacchiramonaceae bacterium]|nr:hypothetical protein [Candidatus Saccharimonadaceae bacterium]
MEKDLKKLQSVVNATKAASEGLFEITIPEWSRGFSTEEIQDALDKAGVNINAQEVLRKSNK